jgi:RimJ/RimL family protein N-acetyltransferase
MSAAIRADLRTEGRSRSMACPSRTTNQDTGDVEITALGQPIGGALPGWTARPRPTASVLVGDYCRLERLEPHHAEQLFAADQGDVEGASWTYLPYGPFGDFASYRDWVLQVCGDDDPRFYAILNTESSTNVDAVGVLSYLRIQPEVGSIEVGHVHYSPYLQRHRAATEAQYLLLNYAFEDLGYRRYEWKCDALNAPSRAAAERLGFTYEGTFRQASVVKGRNRDTAWYSVIDTEWPSVRDRLSSWLAPENFDEHGRQITALRRS